MGPNAIGLQFLKRRSLMTYKEGESECSESRHQGDATTSQGCLMFAKKPTEAK
jgi:hypothetical protein